MLFTAKWPSDVSFIFNNLRDAFQLDVALSMTLISNGFNVYELISGFLSDGRTVCWRVGNGMRW